MCLALLLIVKRAPIFVFEFEKALFEFAAERPAIVPLFELPPTMSSYLPQRLVYLLCSFVKCREFRAVYEFVIRYVASESQASADSRNRGRESAIRARSRETRDRPARRGTADEEQLPTGSRPAPITPVCGAGAIGSGGYKVEVFSECHLRGVHTVGGQ